MLFAVMLFSLNNSENRLSYDNEMQKAVCTVIDQQLQQIADPDVDMPPDIDIPVPPKWRAEERVHVKPETMGTTPFDAIVFDTVRNPDAGAVAKHLPRKQSRSILASLHSRAFLPSTRRATRAPAAF